MLRKRKKEEKIRIKNTDTVKALCPSGIYIARDHLQIDDKYYRFFTIVNYPDHAFLGWLSKLNIRGVTWSYHAEEVNISELIDYTSKSIEKKKLQREQERNAQIKLRAAKDIKNAELMLDRMMSDHEKTVDFLIVVRAVAGSLQELQEVSDTVKSKAASVKIPLRALLFNQEGLLIKNMPFNLPADIRYSNPMPVGNIAAGFPFLDNAINDERGVWLGKDDNSNNIIVDFNLKNESRFNSNIAIIGDSGSGKTTLASDILYQEHLFGGRHFIIDVEGEYAPLAEKLGGQVLDMSGDGYSFNPFEIFLEEDYTDEDAEEGTESPGTWIPPLALHIKHLKRFFRAYDDTIDKYQAAELSMALMDFYKSNQMTPEMSLTELKSKPQLFLKDFYHFLVERRDRAENDFERLQLDKLVSSLKEISIGIDAYFWNRKSNLAKLEDFVVFDIYKLRDLDPELLRTQYFLIITRMWAECIKNRERNKTLSKINQGFIRITCDEFHKVLENPYIAQSMRSLAKMVRKYDSGLMTITQSTTDYLHPKIEAEGKDILSSSVYKFVFAQNTQGLADTKKIFSLNTKEMELFESAHRGTCLALFGNYKTKMINEVPDFILDIIDHKRRQS